MKKYEVHVYFSARDNCIINEVDENHQVLRWIRNDTIFRRKTMGIDFTKANWVHIIEKKEIPKNTRKVELEIDEERLKQKSFWQRLFG